jgi:excisionase family DNA binding protein
MNDISNAPEKQSGQGSERISTVEVAHVLNLSLSSTYRALRNDEIPSRKIGGLFIVLRREFEAWLESPDFDEGKAA